MSRSAGPGSPVFFRCWRERQGYGRMHGHRVERTGQTRRYQPPRGSARGIRSTLLSHEYRCSCGHIGWTNHMDILAYPVVP